MGRRTVGRRSDKFTTPLFNVIPRSMENSPMRRVIAPALLAVFVLVGSTADAGFGLFGSRGCDSGCAQPACGCEMPAPVCGCEPVSCCTPKPKFGSCLMNLFKKKSSCCDSAPICEPVCGCEIAPVDCGCAVVEPACGCEAPVCGCDSAPCCAPKKSFGSCLKNLFKKKSHCCDVAPVCEPVCGCEPSCGCGF